MLYISSPEFVHLTIDEYEKTKDMIPEDEPPGQKVSNMSKPLIVWKILKEMEVPDHLTCLLRNLYVVKKQQLELDMENWFQIGKGIWQGCILLPCLLNFYAEYTIGNASLDESQGGIKFAKRTINNLRYADDTLVTESEEELKSFLWEWKIWLET